jgi:glutamine synthetase type III
MKPLPAMRIPDVFAIYDAAYSETSPLLRFEEAMNRSAQQIIPLPVFYGNSFVLAPRLE